MHSRDSNREEKHPAAGTPSSHFQRTTDSLATTPPFFPSLFVNLFYQLTTTTPPRKPRPWKRNAYPWKIPPAIPTPNPRPRPSLPKPHPAIPTLSNPNRARREETPSRSPPERPQQQMDGSNGVQNPHHGHGGPFFCTAPGGRDSVAAMAGGNNSGSGGGSGPTPDSLCDSEALHWSWIQQEQHHGGTLDHRSFHSFVGSNY